MVFMRLATLALPHSFDANEDYIPSSEDLMEPPNPDYFDEKVLIPEVPGPALLGVELPDIRILHGLLREGRF